VFLNVGVWVWVGVCVFMSIGTVVSGRLCSGNAY
jgi:hypothetical protein